jgi:hypothetical protein
MKLLCASNDLAFIHGLRIALDGEDIAHHFSDADMTLSSLAGPMTGSAARLYVIEEADWPRAVALYQRLDTQAGDAVSSPAPSQPSKPWPRGLVVVVSALVFAALGAVLSN